MNSLSGSINNFVVVILAHHTRQHKIDAIRRAVHPFPCMVQRDNARRGALWNHKEGIKRAMYLGLTPIFMEDDALPVEGFARKAAEWINRFPDTPISFYLGTSRPPIFQEQIAERVSSGAEFMTIGTLIHGVCYTIPVRHLGRVYRNLKPNLPADYAVGNAFGGAFLYPIESLVDHEDGEPVELLRRDGEKRTEARKAWKLNRR